MPSALTTSSCQGGTGAAAAAVGGVSGLGIAQAFLVKGQGFVIGTTREVAAEVGKAMGEAWQATSAEMAAADPMTKRVVDSFQSFLLKAQPYAEMFDGRTLAMRKIVLGGSRTVTTAVTSAQAVSAGLAAGFASVSSLGVRGVGVGQSGRLYITDSTNQVVWMKPANSTLRLHAGSPGLSGNNDGVGTAARFFNPDLIAVSANGGLVTVSEPDRCRVRLIETGGQVSTLSSGGC